MTKERAFRLAFVVLLAVASATGGAGPFLSVVSGPPLAHLASEAARSPSTAMPLRDYPSAGGGARIGLAGQLNLGSANPGSGYDPENGYVYLLGWGPPAGVQVNVLRGTAVLATLVVWGSWFQNIPQGPWFATSTGYAYVAVQIGPTGLLSVINGTSIVTNVTIGAGESYGVYDAGDGMLYVASAGSQNVTVVRGSTVVATLDIGAEATGEGYDPGNGYVYVSTTHGEVTAIQGAAVVASIVVGREPTTPVWDANDGYVYVPNEISNSTSVISGSTVIATIPMWAASAFYDPVNGYVYVPGNGGISAILGTSVVAHLQVGPQEDVFVGQGMTYAPGSGFLYVPDSSQGLLAVVNGTQIVARVAVAPFGAYSSWGVATYNPFTNYVYIAASSGGVGLEESNVTVIDSTTLLATLVIAGAYIGQPSCDPVNGLVYVPEVTSGQVSVVNGTTVPTYPLTFTAKGLATGVPWSVTLNGTIEYSTVPSMTLLEPSGDYTYTVQVGNGYTVSPTNASVSVGEGVPAQILNFTAPFTVLGVNPVTFSVAVVALVILAAAVILLVRRRRKKGREPRTD